MSICVCERLDIILTDELWCSPWPNSMAHHYPIYKSDHAPIMLNACNYYERERRYKLFRFEGLWLSREDCKNVVNQAWNESVGEEIHTNLSSLFQA